MTTISTYETHTTIDSNETLSLDMFCYVCKQVGVKAIRIEQYENSIQTDFITSSFYRGSFKYAWDETHTLAGKLETFGLKVTRIKIETMLHNAVVPISDDDAATRPLGSYFEFHTKVPICSANILSVLKELCSHHGAAISRNTLSQSQTEVPLYFVTLRTHKQGQISAMKAFEGLISDLRMLGLDTSNTLYEYSVYDSIYSTKLPVEYL